MKADIRKTSSGRVDKTLCVVVCCDTMLCASCEALAMVNKQYLCRWRDSGGCARQAGLQFGVNGSGVGMLCGGGANRISRRCVARRVSWSVSVVGHQLPVLRPSPGIRVCTPRSHDVAEGPATTTPARCAARRCTARSLAGHTSTGSTRTR